MALVAANLLLVACSSEGANDPSMADSRAPIISEILSDDAAISAGNVAACKDGGFSDNTDFHGTCSSVGGVDHWLAPFGVCSDGNVIKMSRDASCSDHDGFKALLPGDYVPTPKPEDVALCENGLYSSNTEFNGTCSSAGGVESWLAPYGECADGAVINMSRDASCSDHDGFKGLLPVDYLTAPPTTAPPTTAPPATAPPTTAPPATAPPATAPPTTAPPTTAPPATAPPTLAPPPLPVVGPTTDPRFDTCKLAKANGYGPYYQGLDPEYDWYRDADHDGVVCE